MKHIFLSVALLFLALNVNSIELHEPEVSSLSVIDHDGQSNYLYLGNGYHSDTYERKQFPCVMGIEIEAGNVVQSVFSTKNLSFEQARSIRSGEISVAVSNPTMSIGAGAEWAYDVASTALSQSINMTIFYQPKKRVVIPASRQQGTLNLTQTCQNVLDNRQDLLVQSAGNEFVTSINSTANLSVTLKISSTSKSDRDFLAGALKFSRNGIYFEGDLSDTVSKLRDTSKISLNILQIGGDPNEVIRFGAISGQNAAECASVPVTSANGAHLSSCLQIFNDVIEYARTDFKQQLQSNSDFAIRNYNTSRYETSGLDQLIPIEPYELVSIYREMKLAELANLYQKSRHDAKAANFILTEKSNDWLEGQLQPLRTIASKALNNSTLAYDLLTYCEVQPYGTNCVDKYNSDISLFQDYDDSYLRL